MRLPLLLLLIAVFTVAWATLSIIRDHATNLHSEIQQALSIHWSQQSMQRAETRHLETLRRLGQEVPPITPYEEPELPEWIKPYVEMQEDGTFSYSLYRVGFRGHLSAVPSGWFHGAFGMMILVLSLLSLTEARGL